VPSGGAPISMISANAAKTKKDRIVAKEKYFMLSELVVYEMSHNSEPPPFLYPHEYLPGTFDPLPHRTCRAVRRQYFPGMQLLGYANDYTGQMNRACQLRMPHGES